MEAPDHTGPAAPPHAPKQLRTLLAEERDAQNDETAQSKKTRKENGSLKMDDSESKDSTSTRQMLSRPSRGLFF